jgi:hypothetical protein
MMSMLPAFRAEFDKNLTDDDCQKIVNDVKKMKGVLSVSFANAVTNDRARSMSVTYIGAARIESDVKKIKGITRTRPLI